MSVAARLGVGDLDGPLMAYARRRWPAWCECEPELGSVEDLRDLPAWTRASDRVDCERVLNTLARLGSPSGGDDPAAVTALVWLLVPGAARIAAGLADRSVDIDELVASHLWLAARTVEWQRTCHTAATILRATSRGVHCELGIGDAARRADRAWANSTAVDPFSRMWRGQVAPDDEPDAASELSELFDEARGVGALAEADEQLLWDLASTADRLGSPAARGRGGVMTSRVAGEVAERRRSSPTTVKRHAARTLRILSQVGESGTVEDLSVDPATGRPAMRAEVNAMKPQPVPTASLTCAEPRQVVR